MAVIGAKNNITQPKWTKPWAFYTGVIIVTGCLMWAIAITLASANLKAAFDGKLAQVEATNQEHLALVQRQSNEKNAKAVAAALRPLMALYGQVPEVSGRTLQSAVGGIVDCGDYRFVVIADGAGRVVASSDLALIGRPLPTSGHPGAVTARIGEYPWLGTVVLEPR